MRTFTRTAAAAVVAALGVSLAAAPVVAEEPALTGPRAAATASAAPAVLPSLRQWTARARWLRLVALSTSDGGSTVSAAELTPLQAQAAS